LIRATSLPLAIIGLVALLGQFKAASVSVSQIVVGAAGVIVATHLVDFIAGPAATTAAALLIAIALASFWRRIPDRIRRRWFLPLSGVALGATQFMYTYVDYGQVHRVGPLPASAIILAVRLAFTSAAFMAILAVTRITSRHSVSWFRDRSTALFAAVVC